MANILIILFFLFSCSTYAKDFGTYGHVFNIEEEDFLKYLKRKMASSADEKKNQLLEEYKNRFSNPEFNIDIGYTKKYRVFFYDPTITVKEDIKDHNDKVIIKKGTIFNPLKTMKVNEKLIFIDGTKKEHLEWARSLGKGHKWILVKGNYRELEKRYRRPIYFDQYGVLVKTFDIKNVPAKVSQDKERVKIEEFKIKE
ncbi:hypothetical protein LCGC14_1453830 [marine sediment metagenome]|uniref:Type-F conjugative transfer system protein TraW N-terminal domain-containing protein n=1 Tax=marine sediment metagenome TaxID=412755 RepID=A0A0F9JHS4_9ZZZZ